MADPSPTMHQSADGPRIVATANVLKTLDTEQAGAAIRGVLSTGPDLVGLQECVRARVGLLREIGDVSVTFLGLLSGVRLRGHGLARHYHWVSALFGDCVVGARADRYELLGCRTRILSGYGRGENTDRFLGIEPPRLLTIATLRDTHNGQTVSLLSFHLGAGVQAQGVYRADRPRLVIRHRAQVRRLQHYVDVELALGRVVYAVGDTNFDGLLLDGLTSTWQGRENAPGTLGPRRKIDDIFGPDRPETVRLLTSASDHRAVVVGLPA